jgi:hypothetical protein
LFVGIDWAAQEHDVCVLEESGEGIDAFCKHSAIGFQKLIGRLSRLGAPGDMPVAIERPDGRLVVAIERPDGRLVDRLLEAGFPVVPVKAHAIKVWRESEVAIPAQKATPATRR